MTDQIPGRKTAMSPWDSTMLRTYARLMKKAELTGDDRMLLLIAARRVEQLTLAEEREKEQESQA